MVGVLATPATFQGALYASVVERFGSGVTILQDTCPGLVGQIEMGELDSQATREILKKALDPMLEQGIDTVVMGCTHYPFVIPLIRQIVGPDVRVIDPAPAVARQTARLLGYGGHPKYQIHGQASCDFLQAEMRHDSSCNCQCCLVRPAKFENRLVEEQNLLFGCQQFAICPIKTEIHPWVAILKTNLHEAEIRFSYNEISVKG